MSIYMKIDLAQKAINELRPFEGHMLKQVQDYYRVDLTWSSNALEGNTLTIDETKVVLEDGLTIGGKPLRDLYETVGHGRAYDFMFSLIRTENITLQDIKNIHQLFYENIDKENSGVWRKVPIIVTGSSYAFPAPSDIEKEMKALEKWIQTDRKKYHPVEFAALLHLKFVTIHPFIDGNGRTARLIMNLSLIQSGYHLAIIPPILKDEYNRNIRISQNNGKSKPFCDFIAEMEYETQKDIMRLFHVKNPNNF